MGTIMDTDNLVSMRLFQLVSPSLPTGAFTYSQGLEWAIECGWVRDKSSLIEWLESILFSSFSELELPILKRLYGAAENENLQIFNYWSKYILACRETKELRDEEVSRGRAMVKILQQLDFDLDDEWLSVMKNCQIAGFAFMAAKWSISLNTAVLGYVWSWLENMVMAAVKTIPLGQAAGQQVLAEMSVSSVEDILEGMNRSDNEFGGSCPALAISSSLYERQYSRLFRS